MSRRKLKKKGHKHALHGHAPASAPEPRPADAAPPPPPSPEPSPAPLEVRELHRCPRCGGRGGPRRRGSNARNPFLAKGPDDALTCEDCGLDYEGSNAGRSPWSDPGS